MSGGQQLSRRLLSQDVFRERRPEVNQVGRIRLAVTELSHNRLVFHVKI